MYNFYYDDIKTKYGKNSTLLFTDAGSLLYEIQTENIYEDFSKNKVMLNFSSYSADSKYYDNSNKEFPFKMVNGTSNVATEEFVVLKPRMHSFLVDDGCGTKKPWWMQRYNVE